MQDNDIGKAVGWLVLAGKYGFQEVSASAEKFLIRQAGVSLRSYPDAEHIKPASLLRMLDARGSHIMATGNILNRIQRKTEDWRGRRLDNPRHRVSPISRDAAETITAMEVIEAALLKRPAL